MMKLWIVETYVSRLKDIAKELAELLIWMTIVVLFAQGIVLLDAVIHWIWRQS